MINFPKVTDADIAFSVEKIKPEMLEEAIKQGFDKSNNPYNKLFNELFFRGGRLNFKSDLSPDRKEAGVRYLKALMSSFEPRQEEKEAVCAYILSELVEVS